MNLTNKILLCVLFLMVETMGIETLGVDDETIPVAIETITAPGETTEPINLKVALPKFDWYIQPKQLEFYNAVQYGNKPKIGYGGARGGMKSHAGRSMMLWRRLQYANTAGLIIRKTVDDLYDNHIRPMLREHPQYAKYWKEQKKILELPNKSYIRFISADHYDAIFELVGKEFADILVDQAEQFHQEQLEFIDTLNRCTTNDEIFPQTWFTFNPGDVGHVYLKRLFVTKSYEANEDANDYTFIRAYGWDNVLWCRKALNKEGFTFNDYRSWTDEQRFEFFVSKSDYGRRLNRLPDAQRKAQLMGDFDVFEGQFFEVWRDAYHVVKERFDPPRDEYGNMIGKVQGAIDYGERTVMEILHRDFTGRVTFFLENYTEAKVPEERFNAMADVLIERKLFRIPIECDTNMDIDLKHYTGGDKKIVKIAREVFASRMKENAPLLSIVSKQSDNNKGYRIACNEAFMQGLSWTMDKTTGKLSKDPTIVVCSDCSHLIETITTLMRDPKSRDGLDFRDDVGVDDPYDSAKYAYMKVRVPIEAVKETMKTEDDWMQKNVFDKIAKGVYQNVPKGGNI